MNKCLKILTWGVALFAILLSYLVGNYFFISLTKAYDIPSNNLQGFSSPRDQILTLRDGRNLRYIIKLESQKALLNMAICWAHQFYIFMELQTIDSSLEANHS